LLARENRLSSSDQIRQVIRLGKRSSNEFATIHFLPAETSRFAIVTSRAVGNAVVRNKIRRRTKAVLCELIAEKTQIHGVVRYRPGATNLSFDELKASILKLMERTEK
jgi:ribonuclease P protein component